MRSFLNQISNNNVKNDDETRVDYMADELLDKIDIVD
jgi:hypothetical protein